MITYVTEVFTAWHGSGDCCASETTYYIPCAYWTPRWYVNE